MGADPPAADDGAASPFPESRLPALSGAPSGADASAAGLPDLKGKTLALPRCTREHCYLFLEQRCLECDWADIATEVGRSPEAVRKQLERAIERVGAELGL